MPRRRAPAAALALLVLSMCIGLAAPAGAVGSSPLTWGRPKLVDPLRGGFVSVSCAGSTFCLAGDANGRILRYDGRTWSTQAKVGGAGSAVGSIDCVTRSFCAAGVGAAVSTYRGGAWHTRHAGPGFVTGVDCVSTRFCLAVGYGGTYQRYDGRSWTAPHHFAAPNARIVDVSCASADLCFAVGGYRVWRYDGSSWSSGFKLDAPYLNLVAVSCPSRSWCLAIDDIRGSFRFSHGGWHPRRGTGGRSVLTALDCAAVGRCVAGGLDGRVESYTHGSWGALRQIFPNYLAGLGCSGPHFCVAVSYHGQAATMTAAGWQRPTHPDPLVGFVPGHDRYAVRGLSCASAHSCVVVDANDAWLRYDGSSWTKPERIGYKATAVFDRPLSCPTTSFCMALLGGGRNNSRALSGRRWSRSFHVPSAFGAVACESSRRCVAVGDGDANVWDGSRWRISYHTRRDFMTSVACTPSLCVAGTADGSVVTYRHGHWSAPHQLVDLQVGPGLGVSCTRAAFCLAYVRHGPRAGEAFQRISGTWSAAGRAFRGGSTLIRALSCSTRTLCVATSDDSVSTYNGHSWTRATQIAGKRDGVLSAISCAGQSLCVAMTNDGHAVVAKRR